MSKKIIANIPDLREVTLKLKPVYNENGIVMAILGINKDTGYVEEEFISKRVLESLGVEFCDCHECDCCCECDEDCCDDDWDEMDDE